ncbi:hypothetical protein MEO40_20560 [Dolichospermum sp. ST_sed1]|nr:hypothetical protein [Dolichospermum sp. ST_sed1]
MITIDKFVVKIHLVIWALNMSDASKLESSFIYFSEELCGRSDDALRQAYILCLDKKLARDIVEIIFKELAANLASIRREENISRLIVEKTWGVVQKQKNTQGKVDQSELANILKTLPVEARAAVGAIDFLGLSASETCQALGMSDDVLRGHLAVAREKLLQNSIVAK